MDGMESHAKIKYYYDDQRRYICAILLCLGWILCCNIHITPSNPMAAPEPACQTDSIRFVKAIIVDPAPWIMRDD